MTQHDHTLHTQVKQQVYFNWHQPIANNKTVMLCNVLSFSVMIDEIFIWPWYKQLC